MKALARSSARTLLLLCIAGFSCLLTGFAQEANTFGTCTFQDLNLQAFSSAAASINDVGAIVGAFSVGLRTSDQAFLLFGGKFTPFTFPGSTSTGAFDINNHAQIVGFYSDRSGANHGFFVQSGGFQTIDVPGAASTFPMGINNTGDIVGGFFNSAGVERSFLLHHGKFTFFRFPGSATTEAVSINVNSVIVGTYRDALVGGRIHGFMVGHGVFSTLDFPGAVDTFPSKINDRGQVVGSYDFGDSIAHGFVLTNGQFITIDKPGEPLGTVTLTNLRGVNNLSRIVGSFSSASIIGVLAFQGNCQGVF